MNLSTLIAPLLNLASAVKSYGADLGKGNSDLRMAALDRTLGTIASLGLTIGLYRLLKELRDEFRDGSKKSGASGKNERTLLSIQSLIQALVRSVMMGLGIKRIDSNPTANNDNPQWGKKTQMRTFNGSCHCKSISFVLRAPSHIEAQECNGKIKYPYYQTSANNFQLISGTRFVSVYYVDLSDFNDDCVNQHHFQRHEIAAHTFCSRCGVHILRAPNSHSNKLEVNTNCLDDFTEINDQTNSYISINTTFQSNADCKGMSEGKPVREAFKNVKEPQATHQPYYEKETISPWPVGTAHEKDYEGSIKWKSSELVSRDGTPATNTSSTPISGSCISSTTHDSESTSDGMSYHEKYASPFDTAYRLRNNDSTSISSWPVSSSLQSVTSKNEIPRTPRPSTSVENDVKLRPSSLMKDQLKYYMKKHMASESKLKADATSDDKNLDKGRK